MRSLSELLDAYVAEADAANDPTVTRAFVAVAEAAERAAEELSANLTEYPNRRRNLESVLRTAITALRAALERKP